MTLPAEQIARHPNIVPSLRFLAKTLRERFDNGPRLARLLASHQRWLLTQVAYALHHERDPAQPFSGLTTVGLRDAITEYRVASRNTVLSFIEELKTYRFILSPSEEEGRRPRRYVPTDVSQKAMFGWCLANLAALDLLDNGNRADVLSANPHLMHLLQPRVARNCLNDLRWREPPERVGLFLWTEAGGLVVDHLIANLDCQVRNSEQIDIGRIDTRVLAGQFMMSRTHLQRLLRKAAGRGCVGWYDPPKKTQLWMSRDFLDEYCGWQAVKLSIVDEAFAWATQDMGASGT
ncbi:hypothetical protein [Rhizobium sp. BK376]|uniref:hypothetical protein n=1 Tax=Rhizobium sp. BK376 TaxID=2512149 RepID=UPI0010472E8D|nr:hypothetical protein [Rhizobium sp. BK376]TCR93140.1 hypothetical protein EV561_101586 [Rhizobium sp. BK376]